MPRASAARATVWVEVTSCASVSRLMVELRSEELSVSIAVTRTDVVER
jgi:hypothetical protein